MQVRALLYTSTLTNAIMQSMATVEAAVLDALAHQTTLYPRPTSTPMDDYHQQAERASQPVREALSLSGFSGKQWEQGKQGLDVMFIYVNYHCCNLSCKLALGHSHRHYVSS